MLLVQPHAAGLQAGLQVLGQLLVVGADLGRRGVLHQRLEPGGEAGLGRLEAEPVERRDEGELEALGDVRAPGPAHEEPERHEEAEQHEPRDDGEDVDLVRGGGLGGVQHFQLHLRCVARGWDPLPLFVSSSLMLRGAAPPPSSVPNLGPTSVSLAASANFNYICNRQ